MFVNNEITDRGLLHKLLRNTAGEVTLDERAVWARSIERAIEDASRPSTPFRFRLARPAVVVAALPALSAVAASLRDEQTTVSRQTLDAVRRFMTDGVDSPFYGSDPLTAHRAADALRQRVAAGESATRTRELAHTAAA